MKKIIFKTTVGLGIFALTLGSCQKLGGDEISSLLGEDETAIETTEQQIDADADNAS
ncbi:MAG: hypothetical protein JKY42_09130, partial [Flavobacteriales bacterium]|nr:hypothetical protein [Flavobacteriales bacterium]